MTMIMFKLILTIIVTVVMIVLVVNINNKKKNDNSCNHTKRPGVARAIARRGLRGGGLTPRPLI